MALPSEKSISFHSSTGAIFSIFDFNSARFVQLLTDKPTQRLFSRSALVKRLAMVLGQSSDLTGLAHSQCLMDDSEDGVVSPTISDVIRNLLSPATLPHIILLGLAGTVLYLLSSSDSDSLFAIGIAGYVGLSIGYAMTAWMQEMEIIHRFSHFQPLPKDIPFSEKIMLFFVRVITSWISPLLLGFIPFILIAGFLNSDAGAEQVEYWAMALGGLFVVWSLAQGRALSSSLRIFVEGRAVGIASIQRKSKRFTSTTLHMTIIGTFATLSYWGFVQGAENSDSLISLEALEALLFGLAAIGIQGILFWYTTGRRVIDSERKDTAAFGFAWGLFMQLFVTWHLLSAYRRFIADDWGTLLIIEEFILMVMTVVAAIWSLAKDTHRRGFKLFTKQNAVFWGLSFGMAYSGSIAMIAVLGSKLSGGAIGGIGMSATIGIGHLITAGTMMWIHAWRIGQLSRWLDSARDDLEVSQDHVDDENHEDTSEDDSDEVSEDIEDDVGNEILLDIPPPVTVDDDIELIDLD